MPPPPPLLVHISRQFLDAVFQIVQQHPTAFEFTPLLLSTLAYQASAMRFASLFAPPTPR